MDADQGAERQPEVDRGQHPGRGPVEERGAVLASGHERDGHGHDDHPEERRQRDPRQGHRGAGGQGRDQRRQERQHRADGAGQAGVLDEGQRRDDERHDQQLGGGQPPHERQGAKREREAAHQTGHGCGMDPYLAPAATGTDAMPP